MRRKILAGLAVGTVVFRMLGVASASPLGFALPSSLADNSPPTSSSPPPASPPPSSTTPLNLGGLVGALADTPPPPASPPPSSGPPNLGGLSGALADVTPGGTSSNPILPTNVGGSSTNNEFQFSLIACVGSLYYIDPLVAVGYDYVLDSGPNFASVLLPVMGDNSYDLLEKDSSGNWFDTLTDLTGGQEYYFGGIGPDAFRIMGIETSLRLDPNDPNVFVTGLSFTGSGDVTMRQIAVTATVPEPTTMLLLSTGLFGLIGSRRKIYGSRIQE